MAINVENTHGYAEAVKNPRGDVEVHVGCDDPVEVDKMFGPLVFWSLRITADFQSCQWVVEQESDDGWIERARIDGQPAEYYENRDD